MPRVKIDLPGSFRFSTSLTVRITDLNYGSHVGNDKVLAFLHEARVAFLQSLGYSELNLEGLGIIMADAALIFKAEIFFGDDLTIHVEPAEISRVGFELIYKIEKKSGEGFITVAVAKTSMICYDYQIKKVSALPENAKIKLGA